MRRTMSNYNLITREGWDARPPESVTPLKWSQVTRFIVHVSGAVRTQSVRSIQDYCMDNKNHSDIDYNVIVRGRDLNIGRGDNIGSHTYENNSTSYGVCMIGVDGDATDDDFRTIRTWYDELCARIGKQLTMTTHRGVLGTSYTDCPGNELQAWVDAGMPYPKRKVIDMFFGILPAGEMYVCTGIASRYLPPGAYASTVVPLELAGVPRVAYSDLPALEAGGGKLVNDIVKVSELQVPAQTLTVELS